MDERIELCFFTNCSILAACLIGCFVRILVNRLLVLLHIDQRWMFLQASESFNTSVSTFILVVGTYEKGIMLGKGFVLDYYVATLLLSIVYSYILESAAPNPLPVLAQQWKNVLRAEEKRENGDVEANAPAALKNNENVRRRGGESLTPEQSQGSELQKKKPHSRVVICLRRSAPSLIGLYFGMYTAFQWLHVTWGGYLTSHHYNKVGQLRECTIMLQTGPIQGFIVEGYVTFLFLFAEQKISNLHFGSESKSYFVSSCLLSIVTTFTLYTFIDLTGSFANPLLAYALERECLYDVSSVINHIIVYWIGALAGTITYHTTPADMHLRIVTVLSAAFLFMYCFTPGVSERNFILF